MDELEGTRRSADSDRSEADERRELERELEERAAPAKPDRYPGCELLSGGSPREVLHRIHDGDPLGLLRRSQDRLVRRAILMDVARVFPVAVASVAHAAPRYHGEPPLDEWLDRCIDRAVRSLVDRDNEEERSGIPPTPPFDSHLVRMSQILGVEAPLARWATVVFHHLPTPTRRAFYAVAFQGKTIHRWVAEGHGPPQTARERITHAMGMISTGGTYGPPGPDPPDEKAEEGSDD